MRKSRSRGEIETVLNGFTMNILAKRILLCLLCFCALSAARNESEDVAPNPSLYRLVIEARETGNPSLAFILHSTGPVNVPDISELRDTFRTARDRLEGNDDNVTEGLAAYRRLVLQGVGMPAALLWSFCERQAETETISPYCDDPVRWLEAASELGVPSTMVQLGWYYVRLPEPEMSLALKWSILAAAYRDSGGSAALDYWETKGVYPDTPEVRRLIGDWLDMDETGLISIVHSTVKRP